MRRTLAAVACVVALLGMVAPAFAQAPAPKVTINGLFDQVTSAGRNIYDGDFTKSSESEWYARTRFRPDFTFEVGRTKAVLGVEIDLQYGACGGTGADGSFGAAAAGCKAGHNGGLDLNTDVAGAFEVKWIYTEFDLTGKDSLMPFIPVPTVARLGGQPFGTLANYRAIYANGDFAGISAITTFAPNLKTNLAYVQVEEETFNNERPPTGRGEDWAIIFSPEFTPFKGLDIKPLYSYFHATGATNGSARRTVNDAALLGGSTTTATRPNDVEARHTIGIDARWRSGPFSLDPTFHFQFGTRDFRSAAGTSAEADISSWLIDVQGGFQAGPLLLEARFIWTPGNKAGDALEGDEDVKFYEPLNTDTSYYAGWAQVYALGIDYFNGGGGTLNQMSTNVGYDRYGRIGGGLRATYSLTPALAFWGNVSAFWTDQKVDTDTGITAAGIRTAPTSGGDESFLGWEPNLGMTWRFAPNTAFDLVGAYFFAGDALEARRIAADPTSKRDPQDGWTAAARVRFSF